MTERPTPDLTILETRVYRGPNIWSYDPAIHLGGVLYLFLRGMCGTSTPVVDGVPTGVFSWRPPDGLVEDLSKLLDRGLP